MVSLYFYTYIVVFRSVHVPFIIVPWIADQKIVEPSLVIIRRLVPTKKQGEQFLQRWTGRSTLGNKLIRSGGEVPSSFNSVPRHLGKKHWRDHVMTAILPRDGTIVNTYIHSIISIGHLDAFTQLICWVQDTPEMQTSMKQFRTWSIPNATQRSDKENTSIIYIYIRRHESKRC